MRGKLVVGAAIVGLAVIALPGAASARVHGCAYQGDFYFSNRPVNENVYDVSARNMSCSAALRAMARGRLGRKGNLTTLGFGCYLLHRYHIPGETTGATVRCVSGLRAFRFSWAT